MGKLKGLLALVLVAVSIYLGWELLPPYLHKYEFQDDLDEIARRNSYTQKTDEDLQTLIIQKASSLDIPLKPDQITITRTGDGLGISVHYQVHVDMVMHPVDLDFVANSINKRI
jgi:hypothetical protein